MNGDGRTDIIRWKDDPSQNALYISNGDGTFTQSTSFGFTSVQLKKSDGSGDFVVADFTGRGNVEILRMVANPSSVNPNHLYLKQEAAPPDLLTTVTSSTGLVTRLSYAPLSNTNWTVSGGATLYTSGGSFIPSYTSARTLNRPVTGPSAIYPKVDLPPPPMYVVVGLDADSGVNGSKVQTYYSYSGLRASLDGRGVLGFAQVSQQRVGANGKPLTTTTSYLQDHPYLGVASTTQTVQGALGNSGPVLSRTANVYCDKAYSANAPSIGAGGVSPASCQPTGTRPLVWRPYLSESLEEGWDLNGAQLPTTRTTNAFTTGGDLLTATATTQVTTPGLMSGDPVQTFTKVTSNTYFTDDTSCADYRTCNWVRGRLKSSAVTNTVPNLLASITTGAGTANGAASTAGNASLPSVISPTVLTAILQLLLDD
ncbi:MAG TPA: FG-GAP-like repeat-containing protein [Burkholderiaceae bacterium]|nr:FG-GAP-like repeat-containing protein [Burkholderiaceae bacterium]